MVNLISVLICTNNRAELLNKALIALNQARRPVTLTVNILVIANACQDSTQRILEDYVRRSADEGFLPLRWLDEHQAGKSHALNRGTAELTGEWVAIVDDDQRVASDFLIKIEQAIQTHPEATMLCGRILPDWDGSEPTWVHDKGPYRIYPLPIPRQDFGELSRELGVDGPIPGGGNQIMRVDLVRRLGGFSTDLGPMGHNLG
ncbi:MAG: glycosyltransferase family A protein, partial [Rubripirellula sp.]